MILNSPNNPTGRVLTRDELNIIARSAQEHGFWVLSDEIYEPIIYDKHQHISLAALPGMRDLTVTLNGMSKAYAMTGWCLGYLGAPALVCEQILKVQQRTGRVFQVGTQQRSEMDLRFGRASRYCAAASRRTT